MQLSCHSYQSGTGWDRPLASHLDGENTLVLALGSPEFGQLPQGPLQEIAQNFPKACRIGCSAAGEISGPELKSSSLQVAILKLERGFLKGTWVESASTGASLARAFETTPPLILLFMDAEQPVEPFLEELERAFGKETVVVGAIAAASALPAWLMGPTPIDQTKIGVAVALYGIKLAFSIGAGWDVFGPERSITHASDRVLYTLDNRPALELYQEYLGELATGLPGIALRFPLSIRANRQDANPLIRAVHDMNEAEKSLIFGGGLPEGHLARLMHANADRLVDGAGNCSVAIKAAAEGKTGLCFAVSCSGRKRVLGDRAEEELEAVYENIPQGFSLIGLYSPAQLAPDLTGQLRLHNQTFALTAIWEE
jgi:hypothetical protein